MSYIAMHNDALRNDAPARVTTPALRHQKWREMYAMTLCIL
jgi:hypothetical protein